MEKEGGIPASVSALCMGMYEELTDVGLMASPPRESMSEPQDHRQQIVSRILLPCHERRGTVSDFECRTWLSGSSLLNVPELSYLTRLVSIGTYRGFMW